VSRTDQERLEEILLAIETIDRHLQRGPLDDLLVFDAICMRISQIGETVRTLGPETKSRAPEIPWQDVAGMRNHLAHRYFETSRPIVAKAIEFNLPRLGVAVRALLDGSG